MFFRKIIDENGPFQGADDIRYTICSARRFRSAQGVNAGYEEYASLAAALEAWGLRVCSDEQFSTLSPADLQPVPEPTQAEEESETE